MRDIPVKVIPVILEDIPVLNKISEASKKHWGYPDEWMKRWRGDLAITPDFLEYNRIFKLVYCQERLK